MPSVGDALFLRYFFNILTAGTALLYDGDTGWHIITGEKIISTFEIPYSDPYSHTFPGVSWVAHEWLAEVIFALFHRLMGLNGLILLSAAIIAGTFFLMYRFIVYRNVSPIIAALLTILAAWVSTLHWLARPHVFSFPLTLAFFVILELYQREKLNYLRLLPVLMLLWANVHGGYILGLILIGVYAGGNFLIGFVTDDKREESRKAFRWLSITFAAAMVAACINPRGPAILVFPFHLVGREFIMDNVLEWLSPNFHQRTVFGFTLLLYIAVFVLSKRKPDIFEGALALLLTHMSLYSQRYIPLFALMLTPMVAVRSADVVDRLAGRFGSIRVVAELSDIFRKVSANVTGLEARFNRHVWVYVGVTACVLIGLNGGRIGNAQLMDSMHDKDRFPVEALRFAVDNNISGNMFNNDSWGGYIIYKTYPRYRVFMDGRSDMYGVPFLKEYIKVASVQLGHDEVLDKYNVTWIIFNANSPICQTLVAGGRWKLVYADTTANILLKDIPENRELIERYKDTVFVPKHEPN